MSRSPHLVYAVLVGALVALLLGATPAVAGPGLELGVGDAAPDFEGKDYVNTDPLSLKGLRGRVVLLELFSTG